MNLKISKLASLLLLPAMLMVGCGNSTAAVNQNSGNEQREIITVGTSGQYGPFSILEDGKLTGFEIDVWDEIAKRSNLEVKWETANFNGLMGMLDSGKIDTFAQQISITEERKEKYNFSEIYAYNPLGIVVGKDDSSINSFEDLKGKKVATSSTAVTKTIIDDYNKDKPKKDQIELVVYGDGGNKMKDVEMGRVDALFLSEVATMTSIKKANYNLRFVKDYVYDEVNAYPFLKNEKGDKLKAKVDKAIKSMHEDGTLSKISLKWCDIDVTKNPKDNK